MAVQLYNVVSSAVCTLPRTERKFYVAPARVDMAYAVLRNTCLPDHVYPTGVVNSLYFDTFDLDEHDKSLSGDFGKDKVRIRWYGDDGSQTRTRTVFLELKSKQGFAGTKRRLRIEVPSECLTTPHLVHGIVPKALFYNTLAMFSYFPEQMVWPVIKITYQRYRFTEPLTGQRVSLDYHIRSTMVMPGVGYGEHELTLAGAVIEIKGTRNDVPVTLKRMGILDVDWSRFSKYSACIDAHMEQPGTVGRLSPSGRIV